MAIFMSIPFRRAVALPGNGSCQAASRRRICSRRAAVACPGRAARRGRRPPRRPGSASRRARSTPGRPEHPDPARKRRAAAARRQGGVAAGHADDPAALRPAVRGHRPGAVVRQIQPQRRAPWPPGRVRGRQHPPPPPGRPRQTSAAGPHRHLRGHHLGHRAAAGVAGAEKQDVHRHRNVLDLAYLGRWPASAHNIRLPAASGSRAGPGAGLRDPAAAPEAASTVRSTSALAVGDSARHAGAAPAPIDSPRRTWPRPSASVSARGLARRDWRWWRPGATPAAGRSRLSGRPSRAPAPPRCPPPPVTTAGQVPPPPAGSGRTVRASRPRVTPSAGPHQGPEASRPGPAIEPASTSRGLSRRAALEGRDPRAPPRGGRRRQCNPGRVSVGSSRTPPAASGPRRRREQLSRRAEPPQRPPRASSRR